MLRTGTDENFHKIVEQREEWPEEAVEMTENSRQHWTVTTRNRVHFAIKVIDRLGPPPVAVEKKLRAAIFGRGPNARPKVFVK